MGFASKPVHLYEIPFPAITICPENKISSKILRPEDLEKDELPHDS
jgi:hypothetical protein